MIKVCLKEYLERLHAIEVMSGKKKRREVPSMDGLAKLAGIHRVTLNRIANNHGKALKFDTASAIIKALRDLGFDTQVSDLIKYVPSE